MEGQLLEHGGDEVLSQILEDPGTVSEARGRVHAHVSWGSRVVVVVAPGTRAEAHVLGFRRALDSAERRA